MKNLKCSSTRCLTCYPDKIQMPSQVIYNKCIHNKDFKKNCIECKPNSDNINSKLEDDKQDEWRIVMSEKID